MIRRPPRSTLFPTRRSSDLRAFREQLGLEEIYLADLDAIAGARPAWNMYREIQALGCRLWVDRSEEHTSELQSHLNLVCRLLLEKKKTRPAHASYQC